jgi:tetratricopeptide (TPR) repeat protein
MRRAAALTIALCTMTAVSAADVPLKTLVEHAHWKRARAAADARLKANPNDAEALCLQSRVLTAFHNPDAALAPAEKAVALDGRSAEYHWQLAQVAGELASRANLFRQLGLAKRFRSEAEAAVAIDPKHVQALIGLMIFYVKAPGIAGGDSKKASAIVEQVMAIDKADGYIAQSRLMQEQQAGADIEAVLLKALEADASRFDVQALVMNFYAQPAKNKLDLAERHAKAANTIDPDRIGPYAVLAGVYATQERWTELDAVIAGAEKQIPDNLSPYLRAAGALLQTGKDLGRADRYARKYLTQEPEPNAGSHALAHWRLGLILEKEGRRPDAIAEVEIATKLDPKLEAAQKDLKRLKSST